jgi:endonuclease-3
VNARRVPREGVATRPPAGDARRSPGAGAVPAAALRKRSARPAKGRAQGATPAKAKAASTARGGANSRSAARSTSAAKAGAVKRAPAKRAAAAQAKVGARSKAASRAVSPRARAAGPRPTPPPADVAQVQRRLAEAMPDPRCELDHASAWQLLVATILSAQSTDRMVNRVTPALFARYPTPAALAAAELPELEEQIRSTGFFRNKAKAIRGASQQVAERHGGEVPRSIEELVELPGVARKTANVVLGVAYGIASGIAVDTHAARVAQRLGWTREQDPVRIERDLCEQIPRADWIDANHRLILHGRYVCLARAPACAECPLNEHRGLGRARAARAREGGVAGRGERSRLRPRRAGPARGPQESARRHGIAVARRLAAGSRVCASARQRAAARSQAVAQRAGAAVGAGEGVEGAGVATASDQVRSALRSSSLRREAGCRLR